MELASPLAEDNGKILVVSGWRGAGKTTLCQKVVAQARHADRKVAGLLSPGRFAGGEKTGFFALDVATSQARLLASAIPGELTGIPLGPWTFDPAVVAWGNQCLSQSAGADVVLIDEIGPLEFEKEMGWTASFEALRRQAYPLALVVIRPEFVSAFAKRGFSFDQIEVTPGRDLDRLASDILDSSEA